MKLLRKVRVALMPRTTVLRSRTPNGAVLLGANKPGFGGRGAYIHGPSLEKEVALLPGLLSKDHVLIDVGANTGLYTLTAAKHFQGGHGIVVALEPNVEILSMLARSCRLNRFTNVRLRSLCASDSTGAVAFYSNYGKPNSYSMEEIERGAESSVALSVELDRLIEWERLPRLDYVKIDAEGSERRILDGAASAVKQFRPIIQVEDSIQRVDWVPDGYTAMRVRDSHNHLLVPHEHPRMGWLARQCG